MTDNSSNPEILSRILLFGSQITVGGAQKVLLDQAQWFHDRGYAVSVVFYYDKDGLLPNWQARYPFPIQTLATYQPGNILRNGFELIRALFRLDNAIRAFRPDVLESFTHDANIIGVVIGWLANVPVRIATHHGQFAKLTSLKKYIHRNVMNSAMTSKCVCVSERAANQARAEGIASRKIVLIANGIDPIEKDAQLRETTRASLGLTPEDRLVLTVGRLVPEKAQENLINAVGTLAKTDPHLKLTIAGDGPCREILAERIVANGCSENCRLLGTRGDIDALLNAADLFVLCSQTEGMPLALMEAMSAGLPCVGTDLEGIRTLLAPDAGTIVPVNDIDALRDAISALLTDRERAEKTGKIAAGRIRAEYTRDCSLRNYVKLFEKELNEKEG